ncbi:flagellin [Neorhizobium sp. CSC1952]|uniref:flagellin N-terminal helical domain-containing protein n=1 Tax=Neorhizobium sp. CSC1952 TaxID=2978974 RepID=UPI0025A4D152|nr:flagellin [Rhizobium sp. CSC1952]WJR68088.1 flagellin [Rhizobium sp. CSC1952]
MASILTNVNAMAALQTLRGISNDMQTTQDRISSGMRVGTASDNAAYWSIATTMRSDNAALSSVQDAIGLGAAKVDTAYSGMEAAIDVVQEIKNKLITAAEGSADKKKIQEEISQLQDQLKSISSSASFSGENWLQADIGGSAGDDGVVVADSAITKQIVGSFTRDGNGNVSVKTINVKLDETNVLFDLSGGDAGILDSNIMQGFRVVKDASGAKAYAKVNTDGITPTDTTYTWKDIGGDVWAKFDTNGDISTATSGSYLVKVGGAFVDAVDAKGTVDATAIVTAGIAYATGVSVSELDITKLDDYRESGNDKNLGIGDGTYATDENIIAALTSFVDGQLELMTSAAAKLGAVSKRIEMQEDFASKLSDSLERGVGRLVDADMNEESTKLKALQTQQQLAIQALSIANSDSQNILSLFR